MSYTTETELLLDFLNQQRHMEHYSKLSR